MANHLHLPPGQHTIVFDWKRPTDVIVQQGGGDFADARVNAHRNDVGNHHIVQDGLMI